jgi:hypothetical protein
MMKIGVRGPGSGVRKDLWPAFFPVPGPRSPVPGSGGGRA